MHRHNIGELIFDKYEVTALLEQSHTYRWVESIDRRTGKSYIIQLLLSDLDRSQTQEIFDYFDIIKNIRHGNLHIPEEVISNNDFPLLVVYPNYYGTVLNLSNNVNFDLLIEFLYQASENIHILNNRKIIHGRISPNSFVIKDNKIYLSEFGYAPLLTVGNMDAYRDCGNFLAPEVYDVNSARASIETIDTYAFAKTVAYWLPILGESTWYLQATNIDPSKRFKRVRNLFDELKQTLTDLPLFQSEISGNFFAAKLQTAETSTKSEEQSNSRIIPKYIIETKVEPYEGGRTEGTGYYTERTLVQIKAIASPGWEFIDWNGDIKKSEQNFSILAEKNIEIIARFQKIFNLSEKAKNIHSSEEAIDLEVIVANLQKEKTAFVSTISSREEIIIWLKEDKLVLNSTISAHEKEIIQLKEEKEVLRSTISRQERKIYLLNKSTTELSSTITLCEQEITQLKDKEKELDSAICSYKKESAVLSKNELSLSTTISSYNKEIIQLKKDKTKQKLEITKLNERIKWKDILCVLTSFSTVFLGIGCYYQYQNIRSLTSPISTSKQVSELQKNKNSLSIHNKVSENTTSLSPVITSPISNLPPPTKQNSSVLPSPQSASSSAIITPNSSVASTISPKGLVQKYYISIKDGRYQESWDMLPVDMQQNTALHPNGYASFTDWWSKTNVDVDVIKVISQSDREAILNVAVKYTIKKGIPQPLYLRYFFIKDNTSSSWKISKIRLQ